MKIKIMTASVCLKTKFTWGESWRGVLWTYVECGGGGGEWDVGGEGVGGEAKI